MEMEVEILEQKMYIKALVCSETKEGAYYLVEMKDGKWTCTCPSFTKREETCKHIRRAKEVIA